MNKVVYLKTEAAGSECYRIEQRGEQSWWVICQPLAWDRTELPNSRVVKFASSEAEAQAWLDQQQALRNPPLAQPA